MSRLVSFGQAGYYALPQIYRHFVNFICITFRPDKSPKISSVFNAANKESFVPFRIKDVSSANCVSFICLFSILIPFYPTALKGCQGIVFTQAGGRAGGGKKFVRPVSEKP